MNSSGCLFCDIPKDRVITSNVHAYAVRDGYPVTDLHTLIIPKRHVEDYFGLTKDELVACDALIKQVRSNIIADDKMIEGFNIGMNVGSVAGQTIFHCHIHLIPRRKGDMSNPRGGVRGVIPEKQNY